MCGRFTLSATSDELCEEFDLIESPDVAPRYNIAPTQSVLAVVRAPNGHRMARSHHWGLIPSWSKDQSIAARMINARAETVAAKPAFRGAFSHRRCLIPSTGFFEWQAAVGAKRKQPYFIRLVDGGLFAFAGLWERWTNAEGLALESCTIITTEPNERLRPLHNRMPVILARESYASWLEPATAAVALLELLRPFPAARMDAYPVGTMVNGPHHDSPACVEPLRNAR